MQRLTWMAVCLLACSADALRGDEVQPLRVDSVVLRPLHEAEVPAQQTGLLQSLAVAEGQRVETGQVLASLDARQAELAVERAKLEHAQADAKANNDVSVLYADKALEVAKAELERSRESIDKFAKSISQSQLDVERLTVEKLMLERKQAEHELELERFGVQLKQAAIETARLQLAQHQIVAPFAGNVVLVRGRVGEWVEPGDRVVRLVAVDKLRAEGFLPGDAASSDLVGRQVRLDVTFGDQLSASHSGIIRFVSPEMEPVTGQVRFWAEIPNDGGTLRPGQRGAIEIQP